MTEKEQALRLDFIKQAIRSGVGKYDKFHRSDTLILTTFNILKSIFVDNKKHVILSAPTGTGKSVIAYMLNYTHAYMKYRLSYGRDLTEQEMHEQFNIAESDSTSYMLTTSKILQQQIEGDFERFEMNDTFAMLKGTRNYECTKLTKETKQYVSYADRYCMGMDGASKQMLPCFETCPYINQRFKTSSSTCAVMNYAYFLNVLKSEHNIIFSPRDLTIADEAHLIPDIVTNMFTVDLNAYQLNRLANVNQSLQLNFPSVFGKFDFHIQSLIGKCYRFFTTEHVTLSDVIDYLSNIKLLHAELDKMVKDVTDVSIVSVVKEMTEKTLKQIAESFEHMDFDDFLKDLESRPNDIFIKSEFVNMFANNTSMGDFKTGSYRLYKHKLNDMNEAEICKKYFLDKVDTCVYMSATIGNMNDYAKLIGLNENEFAGFRLDSNFDFSQSPIYLVNSAYLNHANFNNTIHKAVEDTLYICENIETNHKGIIHTSTYNIAELLKQKINMGMVKDKSRYLICENAEHKEQLIAMMKADVDNKHNYVIIGASLYEGIDLKDDFGRFNIVVKTPYQKRDEYTIAKGERFPFWYKRTTLEKLEQALGRTNRHINDYSRCYIIDSCANKLMYEMPKHITNRIESKNVNQLPKR